MSVVKRKHARKRAPSQVPVNFQGERPVKSIAEDKLNRSGFAKGISRAIQHWKGEESLVIALYGRWGDGKSSVKGMILDDLSTAEKGPLVIEFNPWEWAGQSQIAQSFFSELGKQLGAPGHPESAKQAARMLRLFGKVIGFGRQVLASAQNAVTQINPEITVAISAVSTASGVAQQVFESGADAREELFTEKPLVEIKSQLKSSFQKLDKKVLIILDDIDRLSAPEIRLVFQLLKINADFPNVIFLALFQRDIVETALEKTVQMGSGREYLDKIVQIGIDLPQIPRRTMRRFVSETLTSVLKEYGLDKKLETNRLEPVYDDAFAPYFNNLRAVYRFFDSFRFHLAMLSGRVFEANIVDLFAIEVLRVFEPSFHKLLCNSKEQFFGSDRILELAAIENPNEQFKKAREDLLAGVRVESKRAVEAILDCLFPYQTSRSQPDAQRGLRISEPDFFDRYFHLTLAEDDLEQADLDELRAALPNRAKFARKLRNLDTQGLLPVALERLRAYAQEFKLQNAGAVAGAIFDIGDDLSCLESQNGFDLHRFASWIIDDHLRTSDPVQRFDILHSAISSSPGIYLPSAQTNSEGNQLSKLRPVGPSPLETVNPSDLHKLQQLCAVRIQKEASNGSLATHPKLRFLLSCWTNWGSTADVKRFATDLARSNPLLVLERFLGGMIDESNTVFERGLSLSELAVFFDPIDLNTSLTALKSASFSARQNELFTLFKTLLVQFRAVQRKTPQHPPGAEIVVEKEPPI